MKLAEYIEQNGLKKNWFAGRIGVAPSHLSRILSGEREPTAGQAQAIIKMTRGWVTLDDLLPAAPAEESADV